MGRNKLLLAAALLVFLSGLGIFLFPFVRGCVLDKNVQRNAESFLEFVSPTNPEDTPDVSMDLPEIEPTRDYPELWEAAVRYNERILENNQAEFSSEEAYAVPSLLLSDYGLESEIFAVITIPKIELEMPVYLGASDKHLADGAAHLTQTSLPIGGSNTNCVIAGHRGWQNGKYFKDIVALEIGDEITLTNLWEELHYTVCKASTIERYDVDKLKIQADKDMLTLFTCYYTAGGYKMRYVVYCERI